MHCLEQPEVVLVGGLGHSKRRGLVMMPLLTGTLSEMPQGLEESKSPLRIPKLQQVLEWLSLLFDAHINSLHRQPGSAQVQYSHNNNLVYGTSLDTPPWFCDNCKFDSVIQPACINV